MYENVLILRKHILKQLGGIRNYPHNLFSNGSEENPSK